MSEEKNDCTNLINRYFCLNLANMIQTYIQYMRNYM